MRSPAARVPGEVHGAEGRVDAQLDAGGLALEELLEQPDAGGAVDALDVEVQAEQGRRRRPSRWGRPRALFEEAVQPGEAVGAQAGHRGLRALAELVVARQALAVEQLVDGPAAAAAEGAVLGVPALAQLACAVEAFAGGEGSHPGGSLFCGGFRRREAGQRAGGGGRGGLRAGAGLAMLGGAGHADPGAGACVRPRRWGRAAARAEYRAMDPQSMVQWLQDVGIAGSGGSPPGAGAVS